MGDCEHSGAVGEDYVQGLLEVHAHFRANVCGRGGRFQSHPLCARAVCYQGEQQIGGRLDDDQRRADDPEVADRRIEPGADSFDGIVDPCTQSGMENSMLVLVREPAELREGRRGRSTSRVRVRPCTCTAARSRTPACRWRRWLRPSPTWGCASSAPSGPQRCSPPTGPCGPAASP
jgi:hypothetical protein